MKPKDFDEVLLLESEIESIRKNIDGAKRDLDQVWKDYVDDKFTRATFKTKIAKLWDSIR